MHWWNTVLHMGCCYAGARHGMNDAITWYQGQDFVVVGVDGGEARWGTHKVCATKIELRETLERLPLGQAPHGQSTSRYFISREIVATS